jgi:hypothetical protein
MFFQMEQTKSNCSIFVPIDGHCNDAVKEYSFTSSLNLLLNSVTPIAEDLEISMFIFHDREET